MRWLSKGGKSALGIVSASLNFLFIIPLLLLNAQSLRPPLKAFKIKTAPAYQKLLVLDFNKDGKDDFLLTSRLTNYFVVNRSLKNGGISPPIKKFFFFPITEIKKFNNRKIWGDFYLALSYSRKLAALVSFTNYGTLQLLNTRSFNSSPSHLCIADIDSSGKNEAMVYGPNFDGVDIISESNFILHAKKYLKGEPIETADFIDVNYDGYPDIAAYNYFTGMLKILINTQTGEFNLLRSIKLKGKVRFLKSIDFNNDGFEDIALLKNSSFDILLGDSVSSFKKLINFELNFNPKKFYVAKNNSTKTNQIFFLTQRDNLYRLSTKANRHASAEKLVSGGRIIDAYFTQDSSNTLFVNLYCKNGTLFKASSVDYYPPEFTYLTDRNASDFYFNNAPILIVKNDSAKKETVYWGEKFFKYREKLITPNTFNSVLQLTLPGYLGLVQYSQGDSLLQFVSLNKLTGNRKVEYFNLNGKILDVEWLKTPRKKIILACVLSDSTGGFEINYFNMTIKNAIIKLRKTTLPDPIKFNNNASKTDSVIYWKTEGNKFVFVKKYFPNTTAVYLIENEENGNSFNPLFTLPAKYGLLSFPRNNFSLKGGFIKFYYRGNVSPRIKVSNALLTRLKHMKIVRSIYAEGISYFVISFDNNAPLLLITYSWFKKKFKYKNLIEYFNSNTYFVTRFNKNKAYLVYPDNEEKVIELKEITID